MANRQSEGKSRAEEVRARHIKNQKEPTKSPFGNNATRKQSSRNVPIARRKTSTPPAVNRKRDRVSVPLRSKGAEVHLPALPKVQFGWRLISGAIFILSLVAVVSFASASTFKVSAINLQGAERLSGEAILSQVDLQGDSIIKLKPQEIQEQISKAFPSLRTVRVTVGFPASVTVKVKERQPLILWQKSSEALWIDSEGIMFPIRGEVEVPLTVIAFSNPPGTAPSEEIVEEERESSEISTNPQPYQSYPKTTPDFVQGVLLLSKYLPEGTYMEYDPEFGLGWQDPQGWRVYFGMDIQDTEAKLIEYQTIINSLKAKNLRPALISLEYQYAPFYRLEQ